MADPSDADVYVDVLFDDGLRRVIPPRRGWRHGLRVVREVLGAEPRGR